MDIRDLKCFLTVCETFNYTHAAEQLYLSRQALCQKIHRLEKELGEPLFRSGNKQLEITQLGTFLEKKAKPIVNDFQEMELSLKGFPNQQSYLLNLTMGYFALTFLSPDVILSFKDQYPQIEIQIFENSDVVALSDLVNGSAQLCIIGSTEEHLNDFSINKIQSSHLYLAIHCDNPLSKKETIRVADLKGQPFISFGEQNNAHNYLVKLCHKEGFEPYFPICVQDVNAAIQLTERHKGISWTSLPSDKIKQNEAFITKILHVPDSTWGTYIVRKRNSEESLASRLFVDYLVKNSKDV